MNAFPSSIVITGGASGIGAATARTLVGAGCHVGLLDFNEAAGTALADELGPKATFAVVDILNESRTAAAHRELAGSMPPIEGLVNCAGIAQVPTPIAEYDITQWERVLDSHVKGTFIACKEFGTPMAERGRGAVVNLASVVALHPGPVLSYGPAKAAVVSLTEILAVEWARRGVRVNAVAPGWTDTPFLRPPEREGERDLTPIIKAIPMGRVLSPDEIADVIVFLLSPASRAVTGVTIPVDGGFVAGLGWSAYGGFPG